MIVSAKSLFNNKKSVDTTGVSPYRVVSNQLPWSEETAATKIQALLPEMFFPIDVFPKNDFVKKVLVQAA